MAVATGHGQVLPLRDVAHPLGEVLQLQQILHAQGLLHIFVGVDRRDAPAGRAELLPRQPVLLQAVQQLVVGHADGGLAADFQRLRRNLDPPLAQTRRLGAQVLQVNDHARPQHVDRAGAENAGGHQVQDEPAPVVDHRMAGVVPALIADHDAIALAEQVHHAALALVAPVDAHNCSKHCLIPQNVRIVYAEGAAKTSAIY